MNAGPYSDENFQKYIEEEFIPLKSQCFWDKRTELMKQSDIVWTPTLLIHDSNGKEHYRLVGYIPTYDLFAHLKFGKGKIFLNHYSYAETISHFKAVIEQHPDAGVTPEAIFFLGVSEYKKTHDARALRRIYDTLTSRYPQSEWARRSKPYSQIPLEEPALSAAK
jgi:hypothetical protein